jgi:hypothetical protein
MTEISEINEEKSRREQVAEADEIQQPINFLG